jgi:hypothetical protein
MLIAVSSFGKGLRWIFLTEPAEAVFLPSGIGGVQKKGEACAEFYRWHIKIASPLSFVFCNRQYHRERGTLPHDRIYPDAPQMVVNDRFDNR